MTAALADTSLFIARETGRPINTARLPAELAVSVITIGELRAGVLSAAEVEQRDVRLATLEGALAMEPFPVDDGVAVAWARLRVDLRDANRRMPLNDSWIAATALSRDLQLVTQDDDYDGVPNLQVIRV